METIDTIIVSHLIKIHKEVMEKMYDVNENKEESNGNISALYYSYLQDQSRFLIDALTSLGKYAISNSRK